MHAKIRVEHVSYAYGPNKVISDLSMSVTAGEALIIAGRSGHGKSTLIELCAGIKTPFGGHVFWDNEDIAFFTRNQMMKKRRSIGYVFQKHALVCNSDIFNNIALPLRYHTNLNESEVHSRVVGLMEQFALTGFENIYPETLSVGQAKCASIARALVLEPQILFLDEPTSGLDPVTSDTLIHALQQIHQQKNITILMVTHSLTAIKKLGWPVVIINNGQLHDLRGHGTINQASLPEIASFLEGVI